MNIHKFILFSLILSFLTGCTENDSDISDKRIASIAVSSSSTDHIAEYSFQYGQENKLMAILFEETNIITYKYDRDVLIGYNFQDRNYLFIYENQKVIKVERDSTLPPGWPVGLKRHFLEINYQHHGDDTFTRIDSSIIYDYSDNNFPPRTIITLNTVSPNQHNIELMDYMDVDSLRRISFEQTMTYDESAPNPLQRWNFPRAYNTIPFHPFLLSEFVFKVPEVFFERPFLPRSVIIKRDLTPVRTTKYLYTYEDNLLVEIRAIIDDHPGGIGRSAPGYPVENIAEIVWE